MKVGTVASKAGVLLAATDSFEAIFTGRGVHGAFPHLGIDPIITAAEAVVNLQQFVLREFDPTDAAVVTVGEFHSGTATNIIPDTARIAGTARTLNEPARKQIAAGIERRCRAIAEAGRCRLQFEWTNGYPPTVNDPGMSDYVGKMARKRLGQIDISMSLGRPWEARILPITWRKFPVVFSSLESSRRKTKCTRRCTATITISPTPRWRWECGCLWSS